MSARPLRRLAAEEQDLDRKEILYSIVFAAEELAACQKRSREIQRCIDHWVAELNNRRSAPPNEAVNG